MEKKIKIGNIKIEKNKIEKKIKIENMKIEKMKQQIRKKSC